MILLDTNVVSEPIKPAPDSTVLAWFDAQAPGSLWVSAVTLAEMLVGVALLPTGRRRDALEHQVAGMFNEDFADRCLPLDAAAAARYAEIVRARRRVGKPISHEDAQIAAIALSRGFALATRNTRDFLGIEGLVLIDPWVDAPVAGG